MRGERPVPDLLVLPQGRWSHTGLGPTVPRAWFFQKRVAAGPSRQEQRRRDCADRAVPSPFFSPYPPPSQGTAEPSKNKPKDNDLDGPEAPREEQQGSKDGREVACATLPESSRVPDLFLPAPNRGAKLKQLHPLSFLTL